jgi:hypothetical protein
LWLTAQSCSVVFAVQIGKLPPADAELKRDVAPIVIVVSATLHCPSQRFHRMSSRYLNRSSHFEVSAAVAGS